ncbi:hypothetical protein [[Mycoplasma] testudinis]|uniref:hypothetical protein n=1 Tax=[Mycoplasma] testudinis TaxID=33924 RepID=UPI00048670D9|nr:hypothetical protein [[Mycoplasma] testudinis]
MPFFSVPGAYNSPPPFVDRSDEHQKRLKNLVKESEVFSQLQDDYYTNEFKWYKTTFYYLVQYKRFLKKIKLTKEALKRVYGNFLLVFYSLIAIGIGAIIIGCIMIITYVEVSPELGPNPAWYGYSIFSFCIGFILILLTTFLLPSFMQKINSRCMRSYAVTTRKESIFDPGTKHDVSYGFSKDFY